MSTPPLPSSPPSSGTGLIVGTRFKTYNNNFPIIAALLLSEIVQQGLPLLGAIPAGYNLVPSQSGKKAYLITALTGVLEVMFVAFPQPPVVTAAGAATVIVNEFGAQKVVDAIDTASTAGIGPQPGYLYVLENDTLGISAGQYSIGSVYRSSTTSGNNQTFIMQPSFEWFQHVDWLPMVPNLSWVGDWFLYEATHNTWDQTAVLDPREEYILFDPLPGTVSAGNNESSTSSNKMNIAPIALATAGFFIGGPMGAGIGFLIGSLGLK
jgi:hypothetical protein